MEGHSSHVNNAFIERCDEFRISLLILPPHSTHRLQPLDVGLFSPLSTAYTTIFDRAWQLSEARVFINKARFFSTFIPAWKQSVTSLNIQKSFAKAGIIPHNRKIVMDTVFRTTVPPSPSATAIQEPSSPLREGESQDLLKEVKSNKKKASHAVVKMNKKITEVETRCKLAEAAANPLRETVRLSAKKRAFKPIVPGHEERHGVWIGPEEVEAHRRLQMEIEAGKEVEERKKDAKKKAVATRKVEMQAEKAKRDAKKAERIARHPQPIASGSGGWLPYSRAHTELDPNQARFAAGPSYSTQV